MKKNKKKPHRSASKRPTQTSQTASNVPPPRNLTPELCNSLRRDLLKACQRVAETHGLTIEGGELSGIDLRHRFEISLRVGIPMKDGAIYSPDKAMFEVLAPHFGLEPSDYGRTFKTQDETFRIVAINPNRPKNPISAKRMSDGRGFKFSADNVVLYLRNPWRQPCLPYVQPRAKTCGFGAALACCVAVANIETVYHERAQGRLHEDAPCHRFPSILPTDTSRMHERERDMVANLLQDNSKRRARRKKLDIRVIIGTPPYSAGRKKERDNAKNFKCRNPDSRIRDSHAEHSNAELHDQIVVAKC